MQPKFQTKNIPTYFSKVLCVSSFCALQTYQVTYRVQVFCCAFIFLTQYYNGKSFLIKHEAAACGWHKNTV